MVILWYSVCVCVCACVCVWLSGRSCGRWRRPVAGAAGRSGCRDKPSWVTCRPPEACCASWWESLRSGSCCWSPGDAEGSEVTEVRAGSHVYKQQNVGWKTHRHNFMIAYIWIFSLFRNKATCWKPFCSGLNQYVALFSTQREINLRDARWTTTPRLGGHLFSS